MERIEEFRFNVLEKLRQTFDALDVAAILRDPIEGIPTHMLNVLHTDLGYSGDEVMGEYYFLPYKDENAKFHMFSTVMTLTEEMPDDKFDELGRAANLLNFFLPVGAIVFSRPEKIMAYKYTSLIPMGVSADEALNSIDGNIGLSLQLISQYVDVLMKLVRGDIQFIEFLKELPQAYNM